MSIILQRTLAALKATGAKYVIIMPDGTVHQQGDLELAAKKRKRIKERLFPHGTLTKYYLPFIENLQAGESVEIPFAQFPPEAIVSGVSSRAVAMWGRGSAITAQDKERQIVEMLRVF